MVVGAHGVLRAVIDAVRQQCDAQLGPAGEQGAWGAAIAPVRAQGTGHVSGLGSDWEADAGVACTMCRIPCLPRDPPLHTHGLLQQVQCLCFVRVLALPPLFAHVKVRELGLVLLENGGSLVSTFGPLLCCSECL